MKQWSKFFQNPEYLEMTRMITLNKDMRELIIPRIGIKPGMKVLDVGSGSGEYIYYLSQGVQDIEFTGLELDPGFVETANRIKEGRLGQGNSAVFIEGDATRMPFESCTFDLVVSHTIFNSIPNYMDALYEMKRVVKHGSVISTIAAMDVTKVTHSPGVYPAELEWKARYDELFEKAHLMFQKAVPIEDYLKGISTKYLPFIFSKAGLNSVSATPIANFVSTSNASMSDEDKELYIKLNYDAEMKKLKAIYELEAARESMSCDEVEEYRLLALKKRDYLLENIGENSIWEWIGNADLLVTGIKPAQDEMIMSLFRC